MTDPRLLHHATVDRRGFIRRAGMAALAAGGAAPFLEACASGDGVRAAGGSTAAPTTTAPLPFPALDPARPYWMQGGFAPVTKETEAAALTVRGKLPAALAGLYVRNGSNPASGDSPHWFLGDGMVHGVRLRRGKALWYRNRYVDNPPHREGGGLLGGGVPGGARSQSNVSVFHHAGRLLASGEVGFPYELSPDDLATRGPHDFGGRLTTSMTAHPKIDPATGRMHFFGYGFTPPYLTYHVADPDGTLTHSTSIDVAGPTMIHDFAVTDREAVFWELPVVFDMDLAVAAVSGAGGGFPFRWDESYGGRIGVLPLDADGSAIRWVEIPPCYVFHGVNAWRDGDDVVVDVCRMPSAFVDGDLSAPVLHRWRIGTSGAELTFRDEIVADEVLDLPTIDRRFTGRTTRHAWLLETRREGDWPVEFAGLARTDRRDGVVDRYEPGLGERVNEATFVPASSTAGEGDGWLLSYAWNRARDATDLLVFEALDLSAGPIARVELPVRVPYGFHGCWVPDEA